MLRGDSRPTWLKYETVVRYLSEFAVYQPDEPVPDLPAMLARFQRLWLACENLTKATEPEPAAPVPAPPGRSRQPVLASNEIGGDPPPRNTRFVGREHQLRAIHEILRTGAPLLTLTGIGGAGKTQLAAEYVYRFRDEYDVIWWVPAEHTPPLRASLAELGTRLNLPRGGSLQHPPAQVLEELRRSAQLWLLVFDNARSPNRTPLIRALGAGKVLITSRDPDWVKIGPTLDIGVFERQESIELLRSRAENIANRDADVVAEKVGDLPLAVDQVANWHVATGTPVASLLNRLDQQAREILSDPKATASSYPVTLASALTVAFEQLTPAGAQLLELFALLGSGPVSPALLRRGRHGEVTEPLRKALRHEPLMNKAVRELRRHGLVNVLNTSTERMQMHRVFQSVLRDWLDADRLTRGRDNLRAILAAANPGEPENPKFWSHYNEVGPHIHRADLATASDFEVRRVMLDQARYLYKIGHYEESLALSEHLVTAYQESTNEMDHEFNVLANLYRSNASRMLGLYAEARRLTTASLEYMDHDPTFGEDHEYRAVLRNQRALDLRIAGEYEEALAVESDNLRRDDPDDWETSRVNRNNLAVTHRLLGRFAEARRIDQDIVREWEQEGRKHDPRALLARCNLARDLYGLGRYRDALDVLDAALPGYREVVGANHSGVLQGIRGQVMALRKLGHTTDAVSLARENHHDTAQWFGDDHEYTLSAGISLVNALLAAGDLGNATIQAGAVLAGCERVFGGTHPTTLAMLVNSAAVRRALGDVREARRRDERAMTELRGTLGDQHPYTLCARHNYAVDLALLGFEGRSLDEFKLVQQDSLVHRDSTHPDHLAGVINLALARIAVGAPGQQALTEATAALETQLGTGHPTVLAAWERRWVECDIEPPAT